MRYSHSRVEQFEKCKLAFQFKYIFNVNLINTLDADDPLIIGKAIHEAIESNNKYFDMFPVITDKHVNEDIKIGLQAERVKRKLNSFNCEYEVKLETDDFLGFIDLVITNKNGSVSLYDFKYSNNEAHYLKSRQLHVYKYYYEKLFNKKVEKLGYIFIPKTFIRQKKTEDLFNFRKRILESLEQPYIKYVEYDQTKVDEHFKIINTINNTNFNGLFPFCNNPYCEYCRNLEKGANYMFELPKNNKRDRVVDVKPDLWIYADSYVGKSTFVDKFDNVLFINTDGNTDNTESPFVLIRDEKTLTSRVLKTKYGWETFLEIIDGLETQENTFETIAIDLIEDLRELCRIYKLNKEGWEHESDGSFGKGWQMVTTEFNNAIKRLKGLGYRLVFISKERREELKLKNGITRTKFEPNIDSKTANVLSGTVDLTVRAFVDEDNNRKLRLKKVNNEFGGGRFNFKRDIINLDINEFKEALIEAQEGIATKPTKVSKQEPEPVIEALADIVEEDKPKRRRKKKEEAPEIITDEDGNELVNPFTEDVALEEVEKKTRKRRQRGE